MILDILLGGTNYHTEHHLFPTVSVFRLHRAREVTSRFCQERGFPYVETTLTAGLKSVASSLKRPDKTKAPNSPDVAFGGARCAPTPEEIVRSWAVGVDNPSLDYDVSGFDFNLPF